MSDLLFLDVETPNGRNDRICSIGLVRCDNSGAVLQEDSFLVNPEEPFWDINIRLTGIAPLDVRDAPTFPEIWESSLRTIFADAFLVAHNATFDLSVLWKIFDAYSLGLPEWDYACTKTLAKQRHPEFPDYKLPTVCRCLGLEMGTHHRALDDADACRRVYQALLAEDEDHLPSFLSYYPGHSKPRYTGQVGEPKAPHKRISEKTSDYREFIELCESIVANNDVSVEEALIALQYIDSHERLSEDASVAEVSSLLTAALADGDIDQDESSRLVELLQKVIDPCGSPSAVGKVVIDGKAFCLTGAFDHGSKAAITKFLADRGGTVLSGVSKKCDYVLVGGQGSEMWTTKNYGSKVKKALDLQAKGDDIKIIGEEALDF